MLICCVQLSSLYVGVILVLNSVVPPMLPALLGQLPHLLLGFVHFYFICTLSKQNRFFSGSYNHMAIPSVNAVFELIRPELSFSENCIKVGLTQSAEKERIKNMFQLF